ncbi:cupin-like domain-containing protein [Acinetobacter pittii]|uniref:cupin-like domain-containing protein n=1 Tax=Acinetobacter pittii TaxID=48296 RepID=UPI000B355A13|nr:cupin-like domain-containing protein [Acinetobacter pittii]
MAAYNQIEIFEQSKKWFDQLPFEWKNWLEENLEKGCGIEQLVEVLKANGFGPKLKVNDLNLQTLSDYDQEWIIEQVLNEVTSAEIIKILIEKGHDGLKIKEYLNNLENNQLYKILKKKHHQLKKREWLIETVDQLAQLNSGYSKKIPSIKAPSFSDFMKDYYSQHRPVILKNGIEHWPALRKWSPEYLALQFGQHLVEVQMNRNKDEHFERHSPSLKQKMKMSEFVSKVMSVDASNDFYMTANNATNSHQMLQELFLDIDDFAEGYCDLALKDGRSFLWFGPKGTFTPLHHDLTNNMLVQIYGRKKVTLIPALQVPHLYNDHWVFSELSNANKIDLEKYPLAKSITPVECILNAGDALFIPIGWWHSVESLDVSISISFTHFKAPNHYVNRFPKEV